MPPGPAWRRCRGLATRAAVNFPSPAAFTGLAVRKLKARNSKLPRINKTINNPQFQLLQLNLVTDSFPAVQVGGENVSFSDRDFFFFFLWDFLFFHIFLRSLNSLKGLVREGEYPGAAAALNKI